MCVLTNEKLKLSFHYLQKNDIDYEQHTAGQYKRTLTLFGKNDDAARQKFRAELESIHQQFKQFVASHRPRLDLDAVATFISCASPDAQLALAVLVRE